MKLTDKEKMKIDNMRKCGFGYRRIARFLGLNTDVVRYYINKTAGKIECLNFEVKLKDLCPNCCLPVIQIPHKRRKIYCSDKCRLQAWHRNHYKSQKEDANV